MGTLTIRNVPDAVVERIKAAARQSGVSMEQELRDLLQRRYAHRSEILSRVRDRWPALPETTPDEVERWRDSGRK